MADDQQLTTLATGLADRVDSALRVLDEIAQDETASKATRVQAARAIVAAGVQVARIAPPSKSAGELTPAEIEERLARLRQLAPPIGAH